MTKEATVTIANTLVYFPQQNEAKSQHNLRPWICTLVDYNFLTPL